MSDSARTEGLYLRALLEAAQQALEHDHYHGDPEKGLLVAIETAQGGIPTNHMVQVKDAHQGFDWTASLFILRPVEPVVVVRSILDRPLQKVAEERLEAIQKAYAMTGFDYGIKAVRRQAWIEGFKEGVRMHVTACNDDTVGDKDQNNEGQ